MSARASRVVVVGRDAALWLTATALQQAFGATGVSVTAVELPTRLGPASTYASLPPLEALHNKLGLDESALLRATQGSFTLGWNVVGPHGGAAPFFLAHGAYGAPIDGRSFFPHWLKARRFGLDAALEDFSPTAMAARHGRMLLPDAATEAFGRTDYGYHLPAIAYVGALKARARRLGIAMHQALDVAVELAPETGEIAAIRLGDDRPTGDLFVDASGEEAVLIGQALGVGVEDWRRWFPANRRLEARAGRFATVPAYAELRIAAPGWTALHASQSATHVIHAYRSDAQDDAAALQTATEMAGTPLSDPVVRELQPGRRLSPWHRNCIAIGAAACAFDPLFDVALHGIQLGIVHLLGLFPAGADFAAERDEYIRITASAFDRVRDFQLACYAANRVAGDGFWGAAHTDDLPSALQHKLTTYQARGDIAPMEDESFAPDLWQALLVGLGMLPDGWPPVIDATPPERMRDEFRRILGFIKDKVLEQPTHDFYLKTLCGSEAA